MNEKLTYEQWRATLNIAVTDEAISDLKKHYDLDAVEETEKALRQVYESYLNEGCDK